MFPGLIKANVAAMAIAAAKAIVSTKH